MSAQPTLVFLSGSLRTGSFNSKLAAAAAREAARLGADAKLLDLADYAMPIYNGDFEEQKGIPDAAKRLYEVFAASDGVHLASPEYNSSVSPLLKNTLDWVSRIKPEEGRPAFQSRLFAIGAASPGGFGGMRGLIALRQVLAVGLSALVIPEQVVVPRAAKAFDEEGALTDEIAAEMLKRQMLRFVQMAKLLAADPARDG
jgi:NAD(P)H-dependent FMN reductase